MRFLLSFREGCMTYPDPSHDEAKRPDRSGAGRILLRSVRGWVGPLVPAIPVGESRVIRAHQIGPPWPKLARPTDVSRKVTSLRSCSSRSAVAVTESFCSRLLTRTSCGQYSRLCTAQTATRNRIRVKALPAANWASGSRCVTRGEAWPNARMTSTGGETLWRSQRISVKA